MSNDKLEGVYSWPVIILMLCIFWPIGLYLIIKRATYDRTAVMNASSGKFVRIVGFILLAIGVLGLIGSLDPVEYGNVVIFLFFIVGGVILLNKARKIKSEGKSIKKYLAIIVNGGERQLDAVASAIGRQYNVVKNDVQKMIDKGFLKDAYINENTREIVLASSKPNVGYVPQPALGVAPAVQSRVVACHCCGANNMVTGNVGECEYCGTPLK